MASESALIILLGTLNVLVTILLWQNQSLRGTWRRIEKMMPINIKVSHRLLIFSGVLLKIITSLLGKNRVILEKGGVDLDIDINGFSHLDDVDIYINDIIHKAEMADII